MVGFFKVTHGKWQSPCSTGGWPQRQMDVTSSILGDRCACWSRTASLQCVHILEVCSEARVLVDLVVTAQEVLVLHTRNYDPSTMS